MGKRKIDAKRGETLAKWYLRLNGYFTVDNFIVHAADDQGKIKNSNIGNYTETDLLGARHKYSKEVAGPVFVANDQSLRDLRDSQIDFIIVEVKTGGGKKQKRPNDIWRQKNLKVIEYILRFAGFFESEELISKVAMELAEKGEYCSDNCKFSVRLILISEKKANQNWKHLTNVLFTNIIDFLVEVRGQSWLQAGIGVTSKHDQWDPLINNIFKIANEGEDMFTPKEKKERIMGLLYEDISLTEKKDNFIEPAEKA